MSSIIKVDTIQTAAGGVPTAGDLGLNITGTVLQVVQKFDGGVTSISNSGSFANFVTLGSLSQTFTPTSSSSKVLLRATVGMLSTNTADRIAFFRFSGGNCASGVGGSAGSRTSVLAAHFYAGSGDSSCFQFEYLDSPATTSEITYKVEVAPNYSSGNLTLNYYSANDIDAAYIPRTASCLTLMEIAQ